MGRERILMPKIKDDKKLLIISKTAFPKIHLDLKHTLAQVYL